MRPIDTPGPAGLPALGRRLQIRQDNDPEVLEFFLRHDVRYRLAGDHLFIIATGAGEWAAGPGDWLIASPNGDVGVERGDYAARAARGARTGRYQAAAMTWAASLAR